jgi:hypothetical protein
MYQTNYSSDKLTPVLNQNNVENVRDMIYHKQQNKPYYATSTTITKVINDMDHFPYKRFYRGVPEYHTPVVFERETGWRKLENNCYSVNKPTQPLPYPNHCFEGPCSIVVPCRQDVTLNNICIVDYR